MMADTTTIITGNRAEVHPGDAAVANFRVAVTPG
jgi:hypothetical protein